MDIEEKLSKGPQSKQEVREIAAYIGTDLDRFSVMMEAYFRGPYRVTQKTAWVIREVGDQHPEMLLPYLDRMIKLMDEEVHDAIPRNTLALLIEMEIPEEFWGKLAEQCFDFLGNPQVAVAIRVHSMRVLLQITQKLPDLRHELRLVIEAHMPFGSAGFKSVGKKVLKSIEKLDQQFG